MSDLLTDAAQRLGIATDLSAGPGPDFQGRAIWARWPRDPLELAHDLLQRVREVDSEAGIASADHATLWRAYAEDWSYVGTFTDAVAMLAIQVAADREKRRWRTANSRNSHNSRNSRNN